MSAGSISFGVVTSRMSLVHSTLFTPATASSSLLRASVDVYKRQELMIEAYQTGRAAGRAGAVDHIALDVADVDTLFVLLRAQQV